jgi:dienelactone hydrolase
MFDDDPQFWFETLRAMGHGAYGMAEPGEVLAVARQIPSGDYDAWHDAWWEAGERLRTDAVAAAAAGRKVSARDAFLRASNYFRSAEFFLHGDPTDQRIDRAYFASVDAFHAYAALAPTTIEPVQIPYQDTVLHGYLYTCGEPGPRPTVVMHNGFDGTAEELHAFGAVAGVERGYTVLAFDGPGQPASRHRDGLLFRPDWENVVGPVLDWLQDRPEVDASRIALIGISLGGLLAPRAAAFEHRLAACVAVDGVYQFMPVDPSSAAPTEAELAAAMAANPTLRWGAAQAGYVMGVRSFDDMARIGAEYSLAGGIAEQIACPTLVCEAAEDLFFAGQPQQLYDHLTCTKTLLRFSSAEGAGAHCHTGAQRLASARIYDWLDDVLGGPLG